MDEELLKYVNYKWIVSAIYREEGYIENNCTEDDEFEQDFFCTVNLDHMITILEGNLEYQMFDKQKLNNIASAMRYFIQKYEHDKDKESKIASCNRILDLTKHPKGKSIKHFYKEEYKIRNQEPLKKVTPDIKIEIDKQLIIDIKYLVALTRLSDKIPVGDVEFLKSVNIFIYEYPKIMMDIHIYQYLLYILKENQKYKENEELQRLNNSLLDYFNETEKKDEELHNQACKQNIFSLLFNSDLERLLTALKESADFFDQTNFDILCEYIIKNVETCMFDDNIRSNAKELLHTFISENPNLNMKYSLNELKISLNVHENKEFKEKNIKFYRHIGKQYRLYLPHNDNLMLQRFKKVINERISSTAYYLLKILSIEEDYGSISANPYVANYINYILDNYPLIKENPMYLDNIEDILIENKYWLQYNVKDVASIKESLEIQKKIKKLRK